MDRLPTVEGHFQRYVINAFNLLPGIVCLCIDYMSLGVVNCRLLSVAITQKTPSLVIYTLNESITVEFYNSVQ
ncbi:hypothetical protein RJT34_04622 [Clitoria ternatea]|uniref:Uncharacterized protein n=1 Tax=Clitoria ternatea TaxID=43366 RepID=A0AAN9Q3L2_CLITE